MERALREVGYDENDIKQTRAELMGAFKTSGEAGQAKWVKVRKAVLRRRAEADAFAKAQEVEALAVKTFVRPRRQAKYVGPNSTTRSPAQRHAKFLGAVHASAICPFRLLGSFRSASSRTR